MQTPAPDLGAHAAAPALDESQTSFLLAQYAELEDRIERGMGEIDMLARSALIATGAIWAWLATHPLEGPTFWPWAIPAVLVVFFAVQSLVAILHVLEVGKHIARIEEAFRVSHLGWESRLRARRTVRTPSPAFLSALIFWLVLFAVTVAVAFAPHPQASGAKDADTALRHHTAAPSLPTG